MPRQDIERLLLRKRKDHLCNCALSSCIPEGLSRAPQTARCPADFRPKQAEVKRAMSIKMLHTGYAPEMCLKIVFPRLAAAF